MSKLLDSFCLEGKISEQHAKDIEESLKKDKELTIIKLELCLVEERDEYIVSNLKDLIYKLKKSN